VVVLQQGEAALARVAQAAQPNGTSQLGEVHPARRPLLSANQDATPIAMSPLRRQNPREEPGALVAHAGICAGGRGEILVPTATLPPLGGFSFLIGVDFGMRGLASPIMPVNSPNDGEDYSQ